MPMMSIDEILLLPSVDSMGFYESKLESVKDVLARKYVTEPEYRELSRAMAKDGQTFAIHIADGETIWNTYGAENVCPRKYRGKLVMGNGHHRVMLAIELGWSEMKYSQDVRYTGEDWSDITDAIEARKTEGT
jgi:hypothetical protein